MVGLVATIPAVNMRISAVIAVGMLMRGKANLVYPKSLKTTKGLSTCEFFIVFSQFQIIRPLYVLVKQDNLIMLGVSRFPNLFVNLN